MWLPKNQAEKKDGVNGIVAVAIDRDKGSQQALKWAIDHLLVKGSTVVLIHVKVKPVSLSASASIQAPSEYIYILLCTIYIFQIPKILMANS